LISGSLFSLSQLTITLRVQSNYGCAQWNSNAVQQMLTASLNVPAQHFH